MIHLLLILTTLSLPADGTGCPVELTVEVKNKSFDQSIAGVTAVTAETVEVRIENLGRDTLTLVEVGDGSSVGWRTPIVTWQAELDGQEYVQPSPGRCGNLNSLQPEEIFDLKPGESHTFGVWIPSLRLTQPGIYRIRLRYENDPLLDWGGLPLSQHDSAAMGRLRSSTPCIAFSNEIVVEVDGK